MTKKIAFELDIQFPFKYQNRLLRWIHTAICIAEPIIILKGGKKE